MLEFDPFGHSNVEPNVVEFAFKRADGFVQVNCVIEAVTVPFGCKLFKIIVELSVAVQPFIGSVTVTTKFPAVEMVFCEVLFPPPQLNVAPAVWLEAVNVMLV
jgi:hypothetical protein